MVVLYAGFYEVHREELAELASVARPWEKPKTSNLQALAPQTLGSSEPQTRREYSLEGGNSDCDCEECSSSAAEDKENQQAPRVSQQVI